MTKLVTIALCNIFLDNDQHSIYAIGKLTNFFIEGKSIENSAIYKKYQISHHKQAVFFFYVELRFLNACIYLKTL